MTWLCSRQQSLLNHRAIRELWIPWISGTNAAGAFLIQATLAVSGLHQFAGLPACASTWSYVESSQHGAAASISCSRSSVHDTIR